MHYQIADYLIDTINWSKSLTLRH